MKVWTNNKFEGYWPVGSAAIVIADTAEDAADMLAEELDRIGLWQTVDPSDMEEMANGVKILCDGNY